MSGLDGFNDIAELLRGADPYPRPDDVPPPGYDVEAFIAATIAGERPMSVAVAREVRRQSPRRRRARRIVVISSAVVLGTAGAAAAYVISRDQPGEPAMGIGCHGDASLSGATTVIEVTDDPIAGCAALWVAGELPDPDHPLPAGQQAPPLVICTTADQALAVFPGDGPDVCEQLGLSPADPVLSSQNAAVVELQERLVDATHTRCISQAEGAEIARRLLDELGLTGWRVDVPPPEHPDDVCALTGVSAAIRTVVVHTGPLRSTQASPDPPAATSP